jgi:SAM-dependent methyltransferase
MQRLPKRMSPLEFMDFLRIEEMRRILDRHRNLFLDKDVLEIGSGTGVQLEMLNRICRSAKGIEIDKAWYPADPRLQIQKYDGRHIPFADATFDLVFSSNVIEHISDQQTIHAEIRRVLRPDGICIHVVPSAAWRVYASIAHYPASIKRVVDKLRLFHKRRFQEQGPAENTLLDQKPVTLDRWLARLHYAFVQPRHGEFGNWFTEHFLFRQSAWRKRFQTSGWQVEAVAPVGLAHTGYCLLGERLNWPARAWLAKTIGSSTTVFVLH